MDLPEDVQGLRDETLTYIFKSKASFGFLLQWKLRQQVAWIRELDALWFWVDRETKRELFHLHKVIKNSNVTFD